ncbi:MAG: ABC transporter ATP-binding protein [Clostridiales bacterium]|nr:ABC transporter ATP-binding protein [Clostridiales bacterium]
MFKLYKKLRPVDWVLLAVLLGLTILQVYCTMTLVDFMRDLVQSIQYLGYRNDPKQLEELNYIVQYVGGWDNCTRENLTRVFQELMSNPAFSQLIGDDPKKIEEAITMLVGIANADTGDIWFNGGMMLLVAAGSMLAQVSVGLIASFVSANFSQNIRSAVYRKVDSFSIAENARFSTPSLITRTTNDVQQVQMANILMLRMAVAAPITAIWAICKIQASSMELTWVTVVAVAVLLVFLLIMMLLVLPKFKIVQKLIDKLNGVSRENLTGIRVVRAYNAECYQEEKFSVANNNITKLQLFTGRLMSLLSPGMIIIMNGVSLAMYWLGASLINNSVIDYATVVAFMSLSSQIIMAFMMLMMMLVLWPRAQVSADRINEVLDTPLSISDPEEEEQINEQGTVEFKNVSFRYPDADNDVIRDITFKAERGQTVAFIGSTGSGKSTLINLVPRFYDATDGEVLVDGVNVKNLKQNTLRKLIGYVPQRGVLFSGTVKENIAFGNPDLSYDEIIDAALIAEAEGFVSQMEKGYDSEISQGGKNVSGGQKQRLSIARAVAVKPEIFIFDDSFSALDYKTDKKVRENLKIAAEGATKLIVAQRIGTIMDADQIIVLDRGEAVGLGTHKELLKDCPVYREIALSQLSEKELGISAGEVK